MQCRVIQRPVVGGKVVIRMRVEKLPVVRSDDEDGVVRQAPALKLIDQLAYIEIDVMYESVIELYDPGARLGVSKVGPSNQI